MRRSGAEKDFPIVMPSDPVQAFETRLALYGLRSASGLLAYRAGANLPGLAGTHHPWFSGRQCIGHR